MERYGAKFFKLIPAFVISLFLLIATTNLPKAQAAIDVKTYQLGHKPMQIAWHRWHRGGWHWHRGWRWHKNWYWWRWHRGWRGHRW